VVAALTVSIDAASSCSLERQPVECGEVAAVIQSRYPTSKPRVDICLDKEARFEAAAEVMKSIADSGFTVGNFDCARAGTTG
jgi:biopolymer transport protein ExbD